MLNALRYIALNPVEAGAAPDPISYRWSSYGGLVGERPAWPMVATAIVRERFANDPQQAIAIIRDFVEGVDLRVSDTKSV